MLALAKPSEEMGGGVADCFQRQSSDEDCHFSGRAESGPLRLSKNTGLMNGWKQAQTPSTCSGGRGGLRAEAH